MMRCAILAAFVSTTVACGGGGNEKTVPTPLAPGEVVTISLCGSTTQPRSPCGDQQTNIIQLRVTGSTAACPCFNLTIANVSANDLGPATTTTYDFSGFRPGNYMVTGQMLVQNLTFTFGHNTSTSTIGIVPSSLQSTSGPVAANGGSCGVAYFTNTTQLPSTFSFNFTAAAGSSGGTC